MREVGAVEAQGRFSQLLDCAEQGEEVAIMRHGREVARLVPAARQGTDHENAKAALRRIRERAEQLRLGRFDWAEWKSFRDDERP